MVWVFGSYFKIILFIEVLKLINDFKIEYVLDDFIIFLFRILFFCWKNKK